MRETRTFRQSWAAYLIWILLSMPLLFVPVIAIAIIKTNTYIQVGDKTIEGATGVFKKNSLHTKINDQISVKVDQGLMGRAFDYGDIIITTPTGKYDFKKIKHPHELVEVVIHRQ